MREHACYKSAGISVRIATKTLVSGAEMECQQEGEQYPKTKRKRPSGAQYRKRRKEEEERRRREAILKYLESSSTANEVPSTSSSGDAVCSEPLDEMTHRSAASLSADGNMRLTTDSTLPVFSVAAETSSPVLPVEVKTDGPCAAGAADWPSYLGDTVRTVIVGRGPYQWQQVKAEYSEVKIKRPSGAQYRKRRKEEEERHTKHREAILKYLVSSSTTDEVPSTSSSRVPVCSEISSSAFPVEMETDELCPADPADWPSPLTDIVRTELVRRGPYQVPPDFVFPKRDGARSCQHLYFFRTLKNGEKIKRNWLTYSNKNNSLFCFCCKLFSTKSIHLINGLTDWKNATTLLNSHDHSPDHLKYLASWKEFELQLKAAETVVKREMAIVQEEKRWRAVLARLIAIVQSLAVRNMALRGDTEKLYCPSNGNFLKEVELLAQFDPIMKDHVHRVKSEYSHLSYLGKHIQNELIECIGAKVVATMVQEIKQSKYFSLILGCTPDVNHTEHLSVLIRIVTLGEDPQVKEHFMGFLETDEFTGQSLATLILQRLEDWQISFDDCRGQSYDNGANMRGKRQGVQATLLQKNPRALFVPCGAHTLSLVVADAAKSSNDAMGFFGVLQKLYSLFSGSRHRWAILTTHVTITLKMWSETRWENRVEALKPLRYEVSGVREALLEVRSQTKDPVMKVEAQFLAEEVGSFRFLLCTVIWYDILNEIQHLNKVLQSETMQVNVAVSLLEAEVALQSYRATGFVAAQSSAKDMCEEMNVEEVLTQKGLRSTDRLSSYESPDEPVLDALKNLEANFFNMVVDSAIFAVKERFQTLGDVEKKFGILSNFQSLPHQEMIEQAEALGHALSCGGQSDLDGRELAQELKNLPDLPSQTMTALELLKFIQAKQFSEIYPNLWVALRIVVTLPVTVASVERCFSKSKLIKTYLRSTMCQERLSSLAVMSINPDVVGHISCDDVIEDLVGGCQQ
ncbi:zinc finger MYM-type protein 1-like isoform X11 [Brienomyrus brachyistius]|uniref:zinc finger MYM-type protein 1-like isoform X11 n=1 Tax=Brienomyrus brachyistius TaxID=42636 RepID=UPI0020B2E929|nr:zinc finger MYM-type protein 1-like isoform X11 [Brienomyrus brachyistius]